MKWRDLTGLLERSRPETAQPALGAVRPFAWTDDDGNGQVGAAPELLNAKRVTQCALSRVCGVCAEPLGRPIVFVGTESEIDRNAFHAPPLHGECAVRLLEGPGGGAWQTISTAHFEFVRPRAEDLDQRVVFAPSAWL